MITVIAGVNGAGKSSIAGAFIRDKGGEYFNPDEATRVLMQEAPHLTLDEANSQAWGIGFEQLTRAVDCGDPYTFETTLGGNSVTAELHRAIQLSRNVRILYCGLSSPQLHIERVAARVANGGHNIPSEKIYERWENSVRNMVSLIPVCQMAKVWDNSQPSNHNGPCPVCLFSLNNGEFDSLPIENMPEWARPLAGAAMKRVFD